MTKLVPSSLTIDSKRQNSQAGGQLCAIKHIRICNWRKCHTLIFFITRKRNLSPHIKNSMRCRDTLEICTLNLITYFIDYIQIGIRFTNIPLHGSWCPSIFPQLKSLRKHFIGLFSLSSMTIFSIKFLGVSIWMYFWTNTPISSGLSFISQGPVIVYISLFTSF